MLLNWIRTRIKSKSQMKIFSSISIKEWNVVIVRVMDDNVVCLKDIKAVADVPLESVVELTGTIQLRPHGQANKASYLLYAYACTLWVTKGSHLPTSSRSIDQFAKYTGTHASRPPSMEWSVIKGPTTPQMLCYTTLWNVVMCCCVWEQLGPAWSFSGVLK